MYIVAVYTAYPDNFFGPLRHIQILIQTLVIDSESRV